jgi:hypothetical protein
MAVKRLFLIMSNPPWFCEARSLRDVIEQDMSAISQPPSADRDLAHLLSISREGWTNDVALLLNSKME